MKFSILQQDLWPALQAVSRSCGMRSQLPVLGNILLQTDKGRLKLAATNLEIGVVKTLKAEVIEDGEVTVPAKILVETVVNLPGEELNFSANSTQLEISSTSFSSTFNGIPAVEFPTIPLSGKQTIIVNPNIFKTSLPQITFAAAVDDGRPILTGILTEIKDKKLQLIATDGYRLAHKIIPIEEESDFKALIPRKTFEEIIRLLSEEETDKVEVVISEDKNQVIFIFANTQLSSRLIEGQFPNWERIIPKEVKARIIVERVTLLKAVKLASVFARSDANIIKLENKPGKIVLSSQAKELGSQTKEIDAQTEGEEIIIAFNAKFLQDALSAFNSSQLIMELSGNLSAAVIKPMGEEGLQYIVMPVNLS